jgi:hypothetical protein
MKPEECFSHIVAASLQALGLSFGAFCANAADGSAAVHSIASSAATSRPGGTVRPSALAVFRLTKV